MDNIMFIIFIVGITFILYYFCALFWGSLQDIKKAVLNKKELLMFMCPKMGTDQKEKKIAQCCDSVENAHEINLKILCDGKSWKIV